MQRYKIVNLIIIGWLLYIFSLPLFSNYLSGFAPQIWRCPYKAITGTNCPFCGMTHDFALIYSGELNTEEFLNSNSVMAFILGISELLWRISMLIASSLFYAVRKLLRFDIGFHLLLILLAVVCF